MRATGHICRGGDVFFSSCFSYLTDCFVVLRIFCSFSDFAKICLVVLKLEQDLPILLKDGRSIIEAGLIFPSSFGAREREQAIKTSGNQPFFQRLAEEPHRPKEHTKEG